MKYVDLAEICRATGVMLGVSPPDDQDGEWSVGEGGDLVVIETRETNRTFIHAVRGEIAFIGRKKQWNDYHVERFLTLPNNGSALLTVPVGDKVGAGEAQPEGYAEVEIAVADDVWTALSRQDLLPREDIVLWCDQGTLQAVSGLPLSLEWK